MSDSMDATPTVHERYAEARREIDRLRNAIEVSESLRRHAEAQVSDLRKSLPPGVGGDTEAQVRGWCACWQELERQGMLAVFPVDSDGNLLLTGIERAVHFIRQLGAGITLRDKEIESLLRRVEAMEAIARTRDRCAEDRGRLLFEIRRLKNIYGTVSASAQHPPEPVRCAGCSETFAHDGSVYGSPVLCNDCLYGK